MPKQENLKDPNGLPPRETLRRLLNGYQVSQLIYVAVKLGLADLLKDHPKSCQELARDTGTHKPSLYRVLRGLASVGVLSETDPGGFELTSLGAYLQTEMPGSLRARALMSGEMMYLLIIVERGLFPSQSLSLIPFPDLFPKSFSQSFIRYPLDEGSSGFLSFFFRDGNFFGL